VKRYPIRIAADRAVRDLLGAHRVGLRGQQVQRQPGSGAAGASKQLAGLALWDRSRWEGGDRYDR
jgi:hypothetical protein